MILTSSINQSPDQFLLFLIKLNNYSHQKININQTHLDQCFRIMDLQINNEPLIIAYYPFRAKGQVCRLLCEYLHLPYRDRFFDPDQWNKFKEKEAKSWVIKDLPFLQDGDFYVTGPLAIATYIAEKAESPDLFGRTIEDKARVDSIRSRTDLSTAMIAMKCVSRPTCELENKKCMEYYWENKIKPILVIYEKQCTLNPWFFPYITILDFAAYEAVNLLEKIFPDEIKKLKKLQALRERVSKIPEIENYEKSERAIKETCPLNFFNKFREEKLRGSRASSSTSSCSSKRKMDLQ